MGKLLLLGATLIGFGGHATHHQPRYWWPAMVNCTVGAIHKGNTFYVGANNPMVYCTAQPAHWSTRPPPVEQPAG
jgi:hypothetical protein